MGRIAAKSDTPLRLANAAIRLAITSGLAWNGIYTLLNILKGGINRFKDSDLRGYAVLDVRADFE